MVNRVIGIDIGGTFTDMVVVDGEGEVVTVAKFSSTPGDPSVGLSQGLDGLGVSFEGVDTIVHATTVATNAILERKGGRCGLITTRGFRDVLELRRRDRPHLYGLWGDYDPLIPRDLRVEVVERTGADGTVFVRVSEEEVREAGYRLLRAGVEGVAVSFLNAHANPTNERIARTVLEEIWPNPFIVLSSEVFPFFREFERTSTAVVSAYVQPILSRYLDAVEAEFRARGYGREILLMQSNGGVMPFGLSIQRAVNTIFSGPAAGVIAAAQIAGEVGARNVVAYDMGGTSFDVSLIIDGAPMTSDGIELEFGVPVMMAMLDVQTIGAGGGSIARLDRGGVLRVGPESTGADPGPVCYGRGGRAPTVTDAHLILGRIDPARPISSPEGFLLAIEPAREVVEQQIAIPLGLSIEEAAEAIVRVVNNRMAGAIRRVSVDRGRDPRDFVLFAFGGAGALHVCDLLYELGGHRAMIPPFPGVTSAWGCAVADLRYDFVTMVNRYTEELDLEEVRRTFTGHVEEGRKMLEKMAHKLERVVILAEADMSYERQTHLIRVPLDLRRLSRERIGRVFRKVYLERYGGRQRAFDGLESLLDRIPIRLIALRTAVIGVRPRMMTSFKPPRVSLGEAHVGQHSVYLGGRFCDCPVYERTMLPLGTRLSGPAILRQDDTTIWIVPGAEAQTDERGNLLLEVNAR